MNYLDIDYFAVTQDSETFTFSGEEGTLTYWHRPLHAMTDAFTDAGFQIRQVSEPPYATDTPSELLGPGRSERVRVLPLLRSRNSLIGLTGSVSPVSHSRLRLSGPGGRSRYGASGASGASVMMASVGEQAERLDRGDWYLDDHELRSRRDACWRLLDRYNSTGPDDDQVRADLLRATLKEVGDGVVVMPRFQCSYGQNITIAEGAFINSNAFLMDDAPIDIGANARLGPGAQLMTALHPVDDHSKRRDGWERASPISLGENVWLGAGVIVGAGVSIGRNSVVGAGSVVVHDLPDHVVAAGVPARVIRSTVPEEPDRRA